MYRNKKSFVDNQRYALIYVFLFFLSEQEAYWVKLIDLSVYLTIKNSGIVSWNFL